METSFLSECALFRQLTAEEIPQVLSRLRAKEKHYAKGAQILSAGRAAERMGLVLSGSVTVQSNDLWGNRSILAHVGRGGFFAETYAWLRDEVMLVDVVANEDCGVLFLEVGALRALSPEREPWAMRVLMNLLTIATEKNLALAGRSVHTAPKSARARIMAYLNSIALQTRSREFDIPFDRQQLADYLNLERSVISKELGRLRAEGLIQSRKNHFVLL